MIETTDQHRPANLANSAVLKMLEEEEAEKRPHVYKRVAWPPLSEGTPDRGINSQPQQQFNQHPHTEQSYQLSENCHQNQQSYHHPSSPQLQPQQQNYQELEFDQQKQQLTEKKVPEHNYFNQQVRGKSPGVIQLRKEFPISQKSAPLISSQPAAQSFGGGSNMRGDLKWPPPEVKAQIEADNEQRRLLTKGPAFRPRRIQKDYSQFFAQHALNATYPGYKIPPGTQHVYCQF